MTTKADDDLIRIEEAWVTRRIMEAKANADRLTEWRGRSFPHAVDVPPFAGVAKWPCYRVSIEPEANVTKLPARKLRARAEPL